ncbi:hypothetical protein BV20DRAFT_394693 [Pilatotrama ljubarskyi]|nr:hypothetical protein BV20DRAFT_394693 [Pilatotrama ljubarskyi]
MAAVARCCQIWLCAPGWDWLGTGAGCPSRAKDGDWLDVGECGWNIWPFFLDAGTRALMSVDDLSPWHASISEEPSHFPQYKAARLPLSHSRQPFRSPPSFFAFGPILVELNLDFLSFSSFFGITSFDRTASCKNLLGGYSTSRLTHLSHADTHTSTVF